MKKPCLYLLVTTSLLFACRKQQLPQETESDPVFYATCEIEGKTTYTMTAGTREYVMDASLTTDTSSNLKVYRADMKKANCGSNCTYGLSILINDVSTASAAQQVDSALRIGSYKFRDNSVVPTQYVSTFKPDAPQNPAGMYQWTVNDGISSKSYVAYQLSLNLNTEKQYAVTLKYSDGSGCEMEHANTFAVDQGIQTNITATKDNTPGSIAYTYASVSKGTAPFAYRWEFNDGSADHSSTLPTIKHTYMPKTSGYYLTRLTLFDNNMDSCVAYYRVPGTLQGGCVANYSSNFTPINNSNAFSKITILVTYNGVVYSSRDVVQAADSKFEIKSVENYQPNAAGSPTKKLHVTFNCEVKNGNNILKIRNGEAIIAVAHQ